MRAFVLVLFSLSLSVPAHAERYTLAQLLARVQAQSTTIAAERETLAVRRAQKLEQELRYLPSGDAKFWASGAPDVHCQASTPGATGMAALNDCIRTDIIDAGHSQAGTSATDRAPFGGVVLNFGATLTQPLFTSLKIESAVRAGRAGLANEQGVASGVELDAAVMAIRVFAQVRSARAILGALEHGQATIQRWLRIVEAELDGKNRPGYVEGDALRLRTQLVDVRSWHADQARNLAVALAMLRDMTFDRQADIDDEGLAEPGAPSESVAVWQSRMIDARPEARAARAGLTYLDYWRRVQRGYALPDLALLTGFQWGYSPSLDIPTVAFANLPVSSPSATIGLVLHQPLTLGPAVARWDQARHDERAQTLRYQIGLSKWSYEVDTAWLDLREAALRRDEVTRGLRIIEGWWSAADQNVALGLRADGRELVEVVINWLVFTTRVEQARADSLVALATLKRVSGQALP